MAIRAPFSSMARVRGVSPFRAGVVALIFIVGFSYFGFSKTNPFSDPYELHALFDTANRLKPNSPVRIAGVNVGKVSTIERFEDNPRLARVTMELKDEALPIHRDAQLKVRARIFLEGNYFVDIKPGTPSTPELESGATVPANQTTGPVQFGQLLAALQSDTRADLQRLLKEFSTALKGEGARGFNQAIKHWADAYRNTSQVNDATRGTEAHDLTRVLTGQAKVFGALSSNEQALKDLVTGLNRTVAAFASQEDNLRAAIPELRDVLKVGRPALASLNRALPQVRAFARDALPGARSSNATLDAQLPFIRQARLLVRPREAGGLVKDLRQTVPSLVSLNKGTRRTLEQNRLLASCQNNVLLPFSKEPIPDPDFDWHTGESFYEESPRALVGLAGESRIADANSSMFRVLAGGGPITVTTQSGETGEQLFGSTLFGINKVRPARPEQRPVFRPGVPCETQEPPDLNAPAGEGEQTASTSTRSSLRPKDLEKLNRFVRAARKGEPAVDPFSYSEEGEKLQLRRLRREAKRREAKR
jgi:phospholipid/cholesterol/gamma-HCH transport system substrate-binding protein